MTEQKLTALIVDDEPLARQSLRDHLALYAHIDVIAECDNGLDAARLIDEQTPDILFLDIHMPKIDGFEVLEIIEHDPAIVFVTAYDEHALKAFDVHAIDYLLKPFSADRFADAIKKLERISMLAERVPLREVAQNVRAPGFRERVLVRSSGGMDVIPVDRIHYLEARDDYVAIHTDDREHLKHITLSALESGLDPTRFVRIHRSLILNLSQLAKIERYGKESRRAILKNGSKLALSKSGYARLRDKL